MVKNTKGGNKSKGMARKHLAGSEERSLRLSSCDLEIYAVVTRVLGHGMFYVATDDFPQLLGHIRNKFRGRSKRDNSITLGCVVLVGLREWEHPNYKECDLLEVYDSNELRQLMKNPSIDFSELHKYIDSFGSSAGPAAEDVAITSTEIEFTADTDYMDGLLPDNAGESASAAASDAAAAFMDDIVDADDI